MGILNISFAESPISIIIFILTLGISLLGFYKNPNIIRNFVLHPFSMIREKRYHTVITSGFVHGDMMHLLFNMMTFFFFGFALERMIGGLSFAIIYFGSMIVADLPSILKNKDNPDYYALGASGGISGILFALILFRPDMSIYMMFIPIPIPSPIFGLFYLAWCWYAARNANDNIGHDAHLWGSLAGIIITIILYGDKGIINHFLERLF